MGGVGGRIWIFTFRVSRPPELIASHHPRAHPTPTPPGPPGSPTRNSNTHRHLPLAPTCSPPCPLPRPPLLLQRYNIFQAGFPHSVCNEKSSHVLTSRGFLQGSKDKDGSRLVRQAERRGEAATEAD